MEAVYFLEVHQARNSSRRGNKIPFRRRIDSSKPTCRQNRCCKNGSDHRFRFPSGPPKHRLSSLKQVEEALDALIASHGECCPLPLPVDVQAELFPEVQHSRTERRKQRSSLAFTRKMRREERAMTHHWRLRQNLLGQAVTELNFQSPETVISWYRRWADEFDARELAPAFWHWRSRYASLASLDWLRDAGEPLYGVMHEISFIVRETPESVRQAERWQVPNKLTHRSHG
ncbi:plasmid SOS inhibition protein A (plasmid) [Escherichia coli]|nr:plasmid SOS inhibition protein A [Escherichia coli]WND97947.1 plasmid SOS inhibition protein A [Escherichia coli]